MNTIKIISKTLLALFLLIFLSFRGLSQVPEDLFPEVHDWSVDVGEQVYTPENLWDLINGAADAYLSYAFEKLYTAEYQDGEEHTIKVYAFKHATPTHAFGIYSQERNPDYEFLDIGSQGFSSPGALYFINGPYYLQLSTNDKPVYDKLKILAQKIAASMKAKSVMPEELELFPQEGLIEYSEKYIAKDFLGYSFMHSAFIADYKKADKEFQLFILSPEDKADIDKMMNEFLNKQDYPKSNREQEVHRVEAKYIGSILFYKTDKYLFGIKNADKEIEKEYLEKLKQ
jgi:hypothetical protein